MSRGSRATEITPVRVCVCDDHPIVRDALVAILNSSPELDVKGSVSSYDEAVSLLQTTPIDVAILDVRLGGKSGLDLARLIASDYPQCRVLLLTAFASDEVIFEASRIGAADLMDKGADPGDIIERVLEVAVGHSNLNNAKLIEVSKRLGDRGVLGLLSMNNMDRRIIELIAEGRTDKQISDTVFLSPQTVRNRISRILTQLGKDNRTQLALLMAGIDETVRGEIDNF